jgi:hypothetical protein
MMVSEILSFHFHAIIVFLLEGNVASERGEDNENHFRSSIHIHVNP